MSVKEQTLAWLSELPDDSSAWTGLHEEARLLRAITVAEEDVRAGRERPLEEIKHLMEAKWDLRRSKSA